MSLMETAIGWLAPADCLGCGLEGSAVCDECAGSFIKPFGQRCWRCDKLSPLSKTCPACRPIGPLSQVFISTNYENLAQGLVQKYKFGHLRDAAKPLAEIMTRTLKQSGNDWRNYIIVPVPTATSRIRQRGFAHSELLAKTIAADLRIEYMPALRRLGQTRQLGAKRADRLAQLSASFAVKNPRRIAGRTILLVDDVITTGGTLIAASKTLKTAGARQVNALIFAKKL